MPRIACVEFHLCLGKLGPTATVLMGGSLWGRRVLHLPGTQSATAMMKVGFRKDYV